VVTLDRVTIYREILLFFFSTANLSKLGPLRPIPSGKASVPFVEPSELTTMGFFRESVGSTYFRKFCRNNKKEIKKEKKKTGTILTWQQCHVRIVPVFFFFFEEKKFF
jgi:hypothetical protein